MTSVKFSGFKTHPVSIKFMQPPILWSDTRNFFKVGHRENFDINVPLNFLQFWYHMSQICPAYFTDIWAVLGSFMMKRSHLTPLFCDFIHISIITQHIREVSGNFAFNLHFQIIMLPLILSHPSGKIDIKCPTWRLRILISSHIACPT